MLKQLQPLIAPLTARAEAIFGQRDPGWPLPVLANHPDGPIMDCTSAPGNLTIWLDLGSCSTFDQALFQMSHEIVHTLEPHDPPNATMLEEGMAVWFSIFVPEYPIQSYSQACLNHIETNPSSRNYKDALHAYSELMAVDLDVIRKIRDAGRLNDITPEKITNLAPGTSVDLAERLCQRRNMR